MGARPRRPQSKSPDESEPLMGNSDETTSAEAARKTRLAASGERSDSEYESSIESGVVKQTGVQHIEAISQTWTRTSLNVAYLGIFLLAISTALEAQTTINLTVYATSAFKVHSLVATVIVVQQVVNAVIKPPLAKIANVFGRLEGFTLAVGLYVIGYIQMAGSNNVKTYASAQIFYAAGNQGIQVIQQIFIADTSDLLNRALFSSLPDLPFLWSVWAGPDIANQFLAHSTWRWGYGIWTIVLPVCFLPLALSLFINARKAAKLNILPPRPWASGSIATSARKLWDDLDVMGILLLSAAISLLFIPLTLAASATNKWHNGSIIAMLVVGGVCLLLFPLWESQPKLSPHPFLRLSLFKNRSVVAGCAMGFFYFAVFYTSIYPYFGSYLQVVKNQSVTAAGHITQTFTFASTVASIVCSLFIKYSRHYKYYGTFGAAFYILGVGLLIKYRTQESTIAQIVGPQIVMGIAVGMISVSAQLGVQASVAHTDVAAATAIFLTSVEIGGAVGSAISGAIWTANLPAKLALYLPEASKGDAKLIFGNLTLAKGFEPGTPEAIAVSRSFQETMNLLLIASTCLAVPVLPLSLLMRNLKLDQVDQRVKGLVIGSGHRGIESPDRSGEVSEQQTITSTDGAKAKLPWWKRALGSKKT